MSFFSRFKSVWKKDKNEEQEVEEIEVPTFERRAIPLTEELKLKKKERELIEKYCADMDIGKHRQVEYQKI